MVVHMYEVWTLTGVSRDIDPGQGCRGGVTCLAVRLPRSFPGGAEEKRSNPVTLEPCGCKLGINDGIMDLVAKPVLPPHTALASSMTNRP